MSEDKTVIKIITDVYCGAEYSEPPGAAVIELTQKEVDRIMHLSEVVKNEGIYTVTEFFTAQWFDKRPLFNFEELGNKFLTFDDYRPDPNMGYEFGEETEMLTSPDYERIDSEMLVVREGDFFVVGYGKWSGSKFETVAASLKEIKEELTKPEPTPRHNYYFPEGMDFPANLEDVPKYLNGEDLAMKMYCKEMLKNGHTLQKS